MTKRSSAHDDLFGSGAEQHEKDAAPQVSFPPDKKPDARDSGPAAAPPRAPETPVPLTEEQGFEREMRASDDRMKRKRGHSCGTCQNAEPWVSERGTDLGFVKCAWRSKSGFQLASAQYFPRVMFCMFYPSAWVAKRGDDTAR